jgi:hypothetical protein
MFLLPLQVCITHVPNPDPGTDFVAVYAPADVNLQATAPIKVRGGSRESEWGEKTQAAIIDWKYSNVLDIAKRFC